MVSPVIVSAPNTVGFSVMPGIGRMTTSDLSRTTASARVPSSLRSRSVTGPESATFTRAPVNNDTNPIDASPSRRISAHAASGVTETSLVPVSASGSSAIGTFLLTAGAPSRSITVTPSCVIAAKARLPSWVNPTAIGR